MTGPRKAIQLPVNDGVNLTRAVAPESVYRTAYAEGSLPRKLQREGDRLPARDAGVAFRRAPAA